MVGVNHWRAELLDDRPKKRKQPWLLALGAAAVIGTGGVMGFSAQPAPEAEEQTVQLVKTTQPVLEAVVAESTSTPTPASEQTAVVELDPVLEGYAVRQLTFLRGIETGGSAGRDGDIVFYHAQVRPVAKYAIDQMMGGILGAALPEYSIQSIPLVGGTAGKMDSATVPRLDEIVALLGSLMSGSFDDLSPETLAERIPGSPRVSPDGDHLFYAKGELPFLQYLHEDIFRMFPISERPVGMIHDARWAPDSRRLAFEADGIIYLYDVRYSRLTELGPGSGLSWRDSRTLVYSKDGALVSVRNGVETDPGIEGVSPRVSPDGQHLTYFVPRTIDAEGKEFTVYDLYLGDFSGAGEMVGWSLPAPSLEWSPGGEMFAVSGYGTIGLYAKSGAGLGSLAPPEGMQLGRFDWAGDSLVAEASTVDEEALEQLMHEVDNLNLFSFFRIDKILEPVDDAFVQDLYVYELDVRRP